MLNHRKRFGIGLFTVALLFPAVICIESHARGLPGEIPGLSNFSLQDITIYTPPEPVAMSRIADVPVRYRTTARSRREIAVSIDGADHILILEPYSLRSPDFRLLTCDEDGRLRQVAPPVPCTYRGTVDGDPNSRVAAAITDGKLNATITFGAGDAWCIQPASSFMKSAAVSTHVLYRSAEALPPQGDCGVHDTAAALSDQIVADVSGWTGSASDPDATCAVIKVCEIALDADFEFYRHNGSSVSAALLDIETVMNGVAEIYEQQLAVTYEITEVIVRTTEGDPYTSTDPHTLLEQFRDQWNDMHTDIHRDIAHLFTGKDLDGSTIGLAYVGAVCNTNDHYGLSQSDFTTFLPSRVALTAHELGHNWSAPHCDSEPECALMCSRIGGCTGDIHHFSSSSISIMSGFRDTRPCLSDYMPYGGGCGTMESPYLIFTAGHLAALADHPGDWDRHFRMMADIDLGSFGRDIGRIGNQGNPFTGVFDGNGYAISGFRLTVEEPDSGIGLFGCVEGIDAVIKKLGLNGPDILAESANDAGPLVGRLTDGSITNCYVAGGSISANDRAGGLVGYNAGRISNCYATDDVSGSSNVGGLAGFNDGTVANCYSAGRVVGSTETGIGGLIGDGIEGGVSASFWDTETSRQSASPGGGTPETTDLMKQESTFTSAGWDFTSPVWTIDDGVDYPRLFLLHDTLYGGGSGTHADPFNIFTAEQLNNIGANPTDWDRHFALMADIDLSDYTAGEFNIIGNAAKAFSGVFDGNGHEIANFSYTSARDNVGLFGVVNGAGAEIRDLVLTNPHVEAQGASYAGSLTGQLWSGTLSACHVRGGSVSGKDNVGGLLGQNANGTVLNCSATCSVAGTGDYVGGLVGLLYMGTVTNCGSAADVTGNDSVGGLVGYHGSFFVSLSFIVDSYSTGDITGESYVGGLVGFNEGTVSRCYSTGNVSGILRPGGLVGSGESGIVLQSFWDTETSGQLTSPGGGTPKTTDLMKSRNTFTAAGWDFTGESVNGTDDIWRLCRDGAGYPRLAWQFPDADFICPDGVDSADFGFFASRWLEGNCGESNACDGADLDDSGVVGAADLLILAGHWLDMNQQDAQ